MADRIECKITGTEELARNLEQLPRDAAIRIVKTGLRKAAQIWLAEMKRTVQQGWHVFQFTQVTGREAGKSGGAGKYGGRSREFGVISRALSLRLKINPDNLGGTASVGPPKKAFWAQWLEFGKRGARKFPFIRPAFESRKQAVLDAYADTVREELKKSMGLR